jgi:IS5 family transposase
MAGQAGFFDAEERLRWLSASGDPLERLRAVVEFEAFRAELEAALPRADRSRGGRPPYDAVLMFRILVLQALYTLWPLADLRSPDEQAKYQLRDRLSFMRFAGLSLHDAVPDAKTIWLYREQLTRAGALARVFARFDAMLAERGYLAMGGQIVDATVVEARRPRLTKEEKASLRDGGLPAGWSKARERQIDRDGRWTIKRGRKPAPEGGAQRQAAAEIAVPIFGYKNHLSIDRGHGFIRRFTVTHAARHDGSQLGAVLDPNNTASGVWADTAYRSKANVDLLHRRGLVPEFQRAKPRGRPMPAHIARGNATRARVRSLVEHVFATEKRRMGLVVRSIGLVRATARITLANLAYNMRRLVWIEGRAASA